MKIYSKFHDYYDSILGYGQDPKCIYKRETELIQFLGDEFHPVHEICKIGRNFRFEYHSREFRNPQLDSEKIYIIFCGKVYPCIKFEENMNGRDIYTYCYTPEQVETYLRSIKRNKDLIKYFFRTRKQRRYEWYKSLHIDTVTEFFNEISKLDVGNFHFIVNSPISLIDRKGLSADLYGRYNRVNMVWINPCLKDIKFVTIVDPFTAFQELSMFISGIMGGESPTMIEISDKDRIAKHGYDKWSFRKLSQKK